MIETHEVAPWIERLARVGYVAKALLYSTIGALAALAAFRSGGRTTDTRGAMSTLLDAPMGRALLAAIALGLLGYALWRLVEGALSRAPRKRRESVGRAREAHTIHSPAGSSNAARVACSPFSPSPLDGFPSASFAALNASSP